MKVESKKEILERRKEIEKELIEMLKETKSDFSLQNVKDTIFYEEDSDDMQKVIAMFDRGGDVSELSNILELVSEAWNYFPHKALKGLSPTEKFLEYQNRQKNKKPNNNQKLLWSDDGPYSQAYLKIERRILDDKMARTFLQIEVQINPYTYRLIKKHLKYFKDDDFIISIIKTGRDFGLVQGFIALPFQVEISGWPTRLDEDNLFTEANKMLEKTEKAILKMHSFVINFLEEKI